MKHLILLVCTLLLSSNLLAQNDAYQPLIRANTYWNEFSTFYSGVFCNWERGNSYFFNSDTLINGLTYQTIYYHPILGSPGSPFCPPYSVDQTDTKPSSPNQFMREDTTERKVYYLYTGGSNSEEVLLYDFSLEVGDTLFSDYATQGDLLIADSIDMVTLLDGTTRKRWLFNVDNISPHPYYCIEGIGSFAGFIYPYPTFITFSCLTNVTQNDVCIWEDGCEGCLEIYNSVEENLASTTQIYPNPTSTHLWINRKNATPQTIQLININGQVVHTKKLIHSQSQMDVSALQKGIYFYKIGNGVQGKLLME